MLTFGSLFAGIGGFDLGFERAGMKCLWQVEIDDKARSVLERHWPDVDRSVTDVKEAGKDNLKAVDLVCGGFPCQDVSVAGRRKGLAGKRSGLWFEFIRVVEELKPEWVVIENVPGLLSSNGGDDMRTILDGLENLRYVIDCDIIDAQYFGVAQRRRRVFIVCQHIDDILKQKTTSSAQTIAQCLIEILGSILVEARSQLLIEYESSTSESKYSAVGLQRRMKLFGIADKELWPMLQANLDAEKARLQQEHTNLDWDLGESVEGTNQIITDDRCENTSGEMVRASELWNIEPQWKTILEDLFQVTRLYTTSMALKQIAESQIYTFAIAVLSIVKFITLSNNSCPTYWNAASSALTVIEEYIDYARQASNSLFTKLEWVQSWRDFIGQAERMRDSLVSTRTRCGEQVLFERESGCWDPAPSRKAWEEVASPLTKSFASHYGKSAGYDSQLRNNVMVFGGNGTSGPISVAATCNTHSRYDFEGEAFISRQLFGIRRLTPTECERLQGFPDGWTAEQSDAARYRQLGNAVCVPVAEWVGRRIARAEGT